MSRFKIEFYKTFWSREWRWRVKSSNGKTVGASSESFKNRKDCIGNAQLLLDALSMYFAQPLSDETGN